METKKYYSTLDAAKVFDVQPQTISTHARRYGIGSIVGKNTHVFDEDDLKELENHIGHYGNPNFVRSYEAWSYEDYRAFVEVNHLEPTGYTASVEELAQRFNIEERMVRGLRRRHRLAARIAMHEDGELNKDKIAKLMAENTEFQLRKMKKGTEPVTRLS